MREAKHLVMDETAAFVDAGSLWDEAVDEKTGKTYYFHIETDEVRWEKPPELEAYEQSRVIETDASDVSHVHLGCILLV